MMIEEVKEEAPSSSLDISLADIDARLRNDFPSLSKSSSQAVFRTISPSSAQDANSIDEEIQRIESLHRKMTVLAKLGEEKSDEDEKNQETARDDVESDVFESILDEIIMPNYPL